MLLVDLDNIYIIDENPNLLVLRKRLIKIQKLDTNCKYFGNKYTEKYIKDNKIKLKVIMSEFNGKDSSDHELIYYGINKKNVSVLTNDKTLQKLVFFLFSGKITFYEFKENRIVKVTVNLDLDKNTLETLIKSYELYKMRYKSS